MISLPPSTVNFLKEFRSNDQTNTCYSVSSHFPSSFSTFPPLFLGEEGGKQDRKMVIAFATIKRYLSFSSSELGPDLEWIAFVSSWFVLHQINHQCVSFVWTAWIGQWKGELMVLDGMHKITSHHLCHSARGKWWKENLKSR